LLAVSIIFTQVPVFKTAAAPPPVSLPIVGVWSSQYLNWNITDPNLVVGSTFPVQINVTGAPGFNGYEFALYFDQRYIDVASYDLKAGLFYNPLAAVEFAGNGSLRLSVVNAGALILAGSGTLVTVTFKVVNAGGVSPLVFAAPTIAPSSFASPPDIVCRNCKTGTPNWVRLVAGSDPIDVATSDGYFNNVPLSSTHPYGPIANFKFTPLKPVQGEIAQFNASASLDPDNSATNNQGILQYIWDFGDKSNFPYITTDSPSVTHHFAPGGAVSLNSTDFLGNFSIRLTVIDRDSGYQGMKTMLLTMSPPANHCVAVTTIFLPKDRVNPGQNITFKVDTKNTGTFQETFNLTVTYGPPNATLPKVTGAALNIGKSIQWPFSFSTSNLKYGVYNLVATVTLYGHNNCRDGLKIIQFSIDPPAPPGQVLLLIGGIIAVPVSLGIASYTIGAFRKKRRLESEAL
jgi:hypothetical protein